MSVLHIATELTIMLGLLPVAFAHKAAPHLFFAFFATALLWMAGGGGTGGHYGIRTYMPDHIARRYDQAAWLVGIGLYTIFRLTNASLGACMTIFFLGVMPLTGALLYDNSNAYCWESKWARENPEQAAKKAAAAAAEAEVAWAKRRKEIADFVLAICISCTLLLMAVVVIGLLVKAEVTLGGFLCTASICFIVISPFFMHNN